MKNYNKPYVEIIVFSAADEVLSVTNSGNYQDFGISGQEGVWDWFQNS